jgi:dGTPase
MLFDLYDRFIEDIVSKDYNSYIYRHHVNHPKLKDFYKNSITGDLEVKPDEVVVDYIASMTDDYFINLYETLFPKSELKIQYRSYFR